MAITDMLPTLERAVYRLAADNAADSRTTTATAND